MKNKTILSIAFFAISLLIIPQMTFASWWKPNTWKIFNRKSEVKTEQKIIATSTPNNVISQTEKATTTPTLSRSSGQSVGTEKIEQKSEEVKKNGQSKEIEKLKKEVESLKQKQSQFKIIEKITEKPIIAEKKESSSSQTKQNENIVTLPNGAVVEIDANGNVVRTIKEELDITSEIENLKKEVQALKPPPSTRRINISRANYTNDTVIKTNTPHRVLSVNVISDGNSSVSFSNVIICMEGNATHNVIDYMFLEKNPGKHYFIDANGCSIMNDESFSLQPKGIGGSGTSIVVYISLIKEIPTINNDKTVIFVLKSIETDGEIFGNLPINGYGYKMPPPPLPKVIATTGVVNTYPVGSGAKDYIFAGIKISTNKEVFLNSIKWNMSGNGGPGDFQNLKTYVDGVPYDIVSSSDGKYFTSNFNRAVVNENGTKEIYIKGDIVNNDSNHTLDFNIYKDIDLVLMDQNENIVIPKAEQLLDYDNSGGFRRGNPWYDGYEVKIKP